MPVVEITHFDMFLVFPLINIIFGSATAASFPGVSSEWVFLLKCWNRSHFLLKLLTSLLPWDCLFRERAINSTLICVIQSRLWPSCIYSSFSPSPVTIKCLAAYLIFLLVKYFNKPQPDELYSDGMSFTCGRGANQLFIELQVPVISAASFRALLFLLMFLRRRFFFFVVVIYDRMKWNYGQLLGSYRRYELRLWGGELKGKKKLWQSRGGKSTHIRS